MPHTPPTSPPLPGQRQEVCPYSLAHRTARSRSTVMPRRGDYLHGQWFWQEQHVQFIEPDALYELAETQEADTTSPDAGLTQAEQHQWLCDLIRTLPRRDRTLMQFRYGLIDGQAHSLRETGRHLGVSPERVRQIEARVIHRLKRRLGLAPRPILPPANWERDMLHYQPVRAPGAGN